MTDPNYSIGELLVQVARASLETYFRDRRLYDPDLAVMPPVLQEKGASFVTLTRRGHLRGCIGNTQARWPLVQDVARNAVAAASRDPRFRPVTPAELADLRLEVTVLTTPQPLPYHNYGNLLRRLRPGIDGVMLSWGNRRGLLLPQVWHRIPTPGQFVNAIATKAGIPHQELERDPPVIQVHVFQAEHFAEPGYREPGT